MLHTKQAVDTKLDPFQWRLIIESVLFPGFTDCMQLQEIKLLTNVHYDSQQHKQ